MRSFRWICLGRIFLDRIFLGGIFFSMTYSRISESDVRVTVA